MYNTILVAADLSAPARAKALLAQAQCLCGPDGTIRLLHVLDAAATDKRRASAMAGLLALSDGTDRRILPVLRDGAVAPHIRAMADADDADLVMLASGLPDMAEFMRQTTATKLTRHATISVLVAPQTNPERTDQHV